MATMEITIEDKDGRSRKQKVPSECYGCGYFYQDFEADAYFRCHYPDNEPAAWAPCEQQA